MFSAKVRTYVSPLFFVLQHLWVFDSCNEQKLLSSHGTWASLVVASLVAEHGLSGVQVTVTVQAVLYRLSTWSAWAELPCAMWNLSGLGMEPVSSALARRFLTTGSTGKSFVAAHRLLSSCGT